MPFHHGVCKVGGGLSLCPVIAFLLSHLALPELSLEYLRNRRKLGGASASATRPWPAFFGHCRAATVWLLVFAMDVASLVAAPAVHADTPAVAAAPVVTLSHAQNSSLKVTSQDF